MLGNCLMQKYCRHFSEGKDTCQYSLQNKSWLILKNYYCKRSAATSLTKKFPPLLYMNIVQVVNPSKGNFLWHSITTVLANVLTETTKGLVSLEKKNVQALSQPLFFDIITAAKQLVLSVIL